MGSRKEKVRGGEEKADENGKGKNVKQEKKGGGKRRKRGKRRLMNLNMKVERYNTPSKRTKKMN